MITEYNLSKSVRDPNELDEDRNVRRTLVMKKCTSCGESKNEDEFYKRKHSSYSHASCKECQLKNKRTYYERNSELLRAKRRRHYYRNKKACRASESKYRKRRRERDIEFKLRSNIRSGIYRIMRKAKNKSSIKYLGCSIVEFKVYLESKFEPDMTWDNYGINGWHIDHIIPISSISLKNEADCYRVLNYKNLQPLWAKDNLKKSNKIF